MLKRVAQRANNNYGKSPYEVAEIVENHKQILPLLRKRADLIINTTNLEIKSVCKRLKSLFNKN